MINKNLIPYSLANNIRSNLLRFVDKEIQQLNKKNSKFNFIKKEYTIDNNLIELEEEFSFKKDDNIIITNSHQRNNSKSSSSTGDSIILSNQKKEKNCKNCKNCKNDKNHRKSCEKNNLISPLENSKEKVIFPLYKNDFYLQEKKYMIQVKKKTSRTLAIFNKPKRDEDYLLQLCESIKEMYRTNNRGNSCKELDFEIATPKGGEKLKFTNMVNKQHKIAKSDMLCQVDGSYTTKNKDVKIKFGKGKKTKRETLFKKKKKDLEK